MVQDGRVTPPSELESVPKPKTVGFWAALVVLGAGLSLFDYLSLKSPWAGRGLDGHSPPVYGFFRPRFVLMGWLAIGVVLAASVITVVLSRRGDVRPRTAILVSLAILFVFALTLAVARPDRQGIPGRTLRIEQGEYQVDVHLVRDLGPSAFVRTYPQLVPRLRGHSITHPPAALLLLYALERLWPRHLVPRALVLGLMASLVVGSAWMMTRQLSTASAAAGASMLMAVTPAVAIFAFTGIDAIYATILASVAATFMLSRRRNSTRLAFIAGMATGLACFVTYAVSFVAAFGVIWIAASRRPKLVIRQLAWAGVGLVAGLLALRVLIGFDVIRSYSAFKHAVHFTHFQSMRPMGYWAFGQYAAWLTYLGLPLAAGVVYGLFSKCRVYVMAFLVPVVIFYALPRSITGLLPGETERTWLFLMPFAATATAVALHENIPVARRPWVLGGFVLMMGIQAVILNALYLNFY